MRAEPAAMAAASLAHPSAHPFSTLRATHLVAIAAAVVVPFT